MGTHAYSHGVGPARAAAISRITRGSLEYGTTSNDKTGAPLTAGQVTGGRWRPLQYFFSQSVYADVMATCGKGGQCFLKNDMNVAYSTYRVVVTEEPLHSSSSSSSSSSSNSDGTSATNKFTLDVSDKDLPAGPGAMYYFQLPNSFAMDAKHVYTVDVSLPTTPVDYELVSSHISLHMAPKDLDIAQGVNVTATVAMNPLYHGGSLVTVRNHNATVEGAALYVTLTTQAQGRFSENCFLLQAGATKEVQFLSVQGDAHVTAEQHELLVRSTRVEHLGVHM
jgi:beta-mannosidase